MRQTAAREPDRPAIGHKTWQAENPDVLLGRTRPTSACHCTSLPACPRTAALRLALCPSLSRVSSFTFVLQRAHLPAFHSHFLTAHNTSTVFLKKNSSNHIFFGLFDHGTFSRAKFPDADDDGFKLFTSLVHCASHSTSSSTQIQERLER